MNRDFIIKEFTDNIKKFQQLAYNIGGEQDADDLFQECSLMLLEFSEERLISYYNPTQGLKPFFIRMLLNQYKSKTSKFHNKYRKQEQFLHAQGSNITYNQQATELEAFEVDAEDMAASVSSVEENALQSVKDNTMLARYGEQLHAYFDKLTLRPMAAPMLLMALYNDFIDGYDLNEKDFGKKKFDTGLKHIASVKDFILEETKSTFRGRQNIFIRLQKAA